MDIWDNSPRTILNLLLSSTAHKYCFSEILDGTGLAPGTVTSVLGRLRLAKVRASDDIRSIVAFPLGNENQKQERGEYKQMNKTGKNIGAAGCKGQNA